MAKKDPTDLSVEEKLKALYQLQTTLSAIDEKKALRGELPLEVQDLEDEIEGLTIRIDKIKREIDEFQKAVSQKKAEINEAQASVDRYKEQLNDVKNNREYDTLSKEIEFQSLEIELCNKKIREAQARIEEKTNELQQNEQAIKERQGDLDIKKGELDEIMEETRAEEEKLKLKVTELEAKIEPRLLASFKRIRKNARNGLGIVYVQRDACGGCFNKIPPQRQLDIKMHKKIIVCEYCGRILIDPELAGVKAERPAIDDKKKATTRKRAIRKTVKKDDDYTVPEEMMLAGQAYRGGPGTPSFRPAVVTAPNKIKPPHCKVGKKGLTLHRETKTSVYAERHNDRRQRRMAAARRVGSAGLRAAHMAAQRHRLAAHHRRDNGHIRADGQGDSPPRAAAHRRARPRRGPGGHQARGRRSHNAQHLHTGLPN